MDFSHLPLLSLLILEKRQQDLRQQDKRSQTYNLKSAQTKKQKKDVLAQAKVLKKLLDKLMLIHSEPRFLVVKNYKKNSQPREPA
jgi:hypothetical protein